MERSTPADLVASFRALHDGPATLVLPNAWDVASARIFEQAGFPALATSSAAVAYALGYPDGQVLPVELHLATLERIARGVRIPLSADVESGYGDDPPAVGAFIARLAQTGVVGYNLEDVRGPGELYSLAEQVARIRAARAAAPELFLNARSDVYLGRIGEPATRFAATTERLRAYAEAGADGVYVPGVADADTIRALAAAVEQPLNVLASPTLPDAAALRELGVRRVSVGSAPMRRTLGLLREIAAELRAGTFGFTRDPAVPFDEANALFRRAGEV